ncbi:MAG: glycolate oxidase subunit GlcE [Chromatiales bacterium]|nr:glycolate oxidase subunit GlcE [Chromatiales bacterium]
MAAASDRSEELIAAVAAAREANTPVCLRGGGSKAFYGHPCTAKLAIDTTVHRGIVSHEPTELFVTVRCGTPLAELEQTLADAGQMLSFEPPAFGINATVGGMLASGLSGPRRPWGGAVRDAVLGARIVNGRAEALRFGGQVMKNVAGYDLSRLMAGAMGTLGLVLDVSLKVLPRPEQEKTRVFELDAAGAIARMIELQSRALPLGALAWMDDRLYVRLSGGATGVNETARRIGGDTLGKADAFWADLREHRLRFFTDDGPPLWRLIVRPASGPLALTEPQIVDWGGAQRWVRTNAPADQIRAIAAAAGGHATRFRGGTGEAFTPLETALRSLHDNVKQSLDPFGLFNPGRLFPES